MPPTEVDGPASLAELLATPGVTEECEIRSGVGFMAFHGGNLERATDVIATQAAQLAGASLYAVRQPEPMRHHLPSVRFRPDESEALARFIDHCHTVVAIHGYGRRGRWTHVLIGGRNRTLGNHVARHLRRSLPTYRFIDDLEAIPKNLRGQHEANPCNLVEGGGVQIELPPRIRGLTPMAAHWPGEDPNFAHRQRLVEALAAAARSWRQNPSY